MRVQQSEPKYGVFIIESMSLDNELNGKFDGHALRTILDLCGIENEYYYIRTKLELEHVIGRFTESNLGFLHIACHGNENNLCLTLEDIDFEELDYIIGDHLTHRRLFLSACQVARFELAQYFIPRIHCFSVIGSPVDIAYDKAAIFWSSFYYLMYSINKSKMFQFEILPTLKTVSKSFELKLSYFSIIKDQNPKSLDHLREIHIENGLIVFDQIQKTTFINTIRIDRHPTRYDEDDVESM